MFSSRGGNFGKSARSRHTAGGGIQQSSSSERAATSTCFTALPRILIARTNWERAQFSLVVKMPRYVTRRLYISEHRRVEACRGKRAAPLSPDLTLSADWPHHMNHSFTLCPLGPCAGSLLLFKHWISLSPASHISTLRLFFGCPSLPLSPLISHSAFARLITAMFLLAPSSHLAQPQVPQG